VISDWRLGIGDWGLVSGDWGLEVGGWRLEKRRLEFEIYNFVGVFNLNL